MTDEKKTLTHWGNPDKKVFTMVDEGEKEPRKVLSQYGDITYRAWCEKERDRINCAGDSVKIITRAGGDIALSR